MSRVASVVVGDIVFIIVIVLCSPCFIVVLVDCGVFALAVVIIDDSISIMFIVCIVSYAYSIYITCCNPSQSRTRTHNTSTHMYKYKFPSSILRVGLPALAAIYPPSTPNTQVSKQAKGTTFVPIAHKDKQKQKSRATPVRSIQG